MEEKPYIRHAIRMDFPHILEIEELCFPSCPWTQEEFISMFRKEGMWGMVAEHRSEVVGFFVYKRLTGLLEVFNFAVHPSCWRRGVGTAMANKLKGMLSPNNRNRLQTVVCGDNTDAHRFWQAMDLKAVEVKRDFYRDGGDAYQFEYRLPQLTKAAT